jgi:hypothetical protein
MRLTVAANFDPDVVPQLQQYSVAGLGYPNLSLGSASF